MMTAKRFPTHWTPEQVGVIWELLEQLREHLLHAYPHTIADITTALDDQQRQAAQMELFQYPDDEDDLPF